MAGQISDFVMYIHQIIPHFADLLFQDCLIPRHFLHFVAEIAVPQFCNGLKQRVHMCDVFVRKAVHIFADFLESAAVLGWVCPVFHVP
jgi:hypothetical protein